METTFTPAAQLTIKRISKAAESYGNVWNEKEVIKAMKEYYKELGVKMPKVVIVEDLVLGFTAARGAALDAARGAAWGAALDAARDAARGAALDAARGAARDAAWGAAWDAARGAARGAALDAARGAAWDAARDAARGAAWGAAFENTGLIDRSTLKFIAIESKILKALENGLGYYFPMKDKLILVPVPIMKVSDNRLHSSDSPAVSWKGGSELYFLSGVRFDKSLWSSVVSKQMPFKDVIGMKNMEQRMAAMKLYGSDYLIECSGALMVNESTRGNKLFVIPKEQGVFNDNEYFLQYVCPSTGRVYVKPVPPEVGSKHDADYAQASTFKVPCFKDGKLEFRSWSKEEYDTLKIES